MRSLLIITLVCLSIITVLPSYAQSNNESEFDNSSWFLDVNEKITDAIKQIQENPFTDLAVKSLLPEIPIVGNFLLSMYDNSKNVPEDKNEHILMLLQSYEKMNEEQLQQQFEKLQENKEEILENQNFLKQLVVDTSLIIEGVFDNNAMLKIILELTIENNTYLKEIKENQISTSEERGIEKQIIPEKTIEIPPEALRELEEKDQIIKEKDEENEMLKLQIEQLKKEVTIDEETELLLSQVEITEEEQELDLNYLLTRANTYYYSGEYEKAISIYDEILDQNPRDVSALNSKGAALGKLGKYEEAIIWTDKVLDIDPSYVSALYNKGVAFADLGKYEEAIMEYDKILDIDPSYVNALYYKGYIFADLGKYEEAITWYDKALEVDPSYVNALEGKKESLIMIELETPHKLYSKKRK